MPSEYHTKNLEYLMSVTSLSLEEWEDIMKPILGPLCNKIGIVRSCNVKLLFSPTKFHGLNIKHLYFWQYLIQLETIVGENFHRTPTKYLI